MRTHRRFSFALAAAIATLCGSAFAQSGGGQGGGGQGGAQGARGGNTPTSQPSNPTSASQPATTPASRPNPTPASTPTPTPASNATPTPASPPATQQENQAQFPSSARQNTNVGGAGGGEQTQLSQCQALTGIPKAECERRDAPDATENLPAGVTPAQRERQAQRNAEAEAARNTPRANSSDTMRAPPTTSTPSQSAPQSAVPPPGTMSNQESDALNRPRE